MSGHFFSVAVIEVARMGVDIFFALSGMLMANILFIKRVPLSTFYKRRISRILPVFFLIVSLIYLSSYIFNLSEEQKNYFYTLFFLRSYLPAKPSIWNTGLPIGHLWSLNAEEHLYMLLSVLTLNSIFRKREYIPLFLLGGGSIVLFYIYSKYPSMVWKSNFYMHTEVVAAHLLLSSGYFLIRHHFENFVLSWFPIVTGMCFLHIQCVCPATVSYDHPAATHGEPTRKAD